MRGFLLFLFLILLAGCYRTARVRPFTGPDGHRAYHITCKNDRGRCLEAAGRTCPGGYHVIRSGGGITGGGLWAGGVYTTSEFRMTVKCRAPTAGAPGPRD